MTNTQHAPDSHCHCCGSRFAEQHTYPRTCFHCGNQTWKNPIPVVVLLIPVKGRGYLLQQRGIDPQKGKWAFIGGFIDANETWRQAAVRELKEEMGLDSREDEFELLDARSDQYNHLLLFARRIPEYRTYQIDSAFKPNEEVMDYAFTHCNKPLCFPLHQSILEEFGGDR